ncbi:Glyceraldehyde-3-phosphate dehydrogenase [Bremerella volcania]|uniref:Glyceraldehyde-3-phosphate dehydrogenase n=1 Tax=Bremerella volcania TaxID=2527984 RepID=A0A518C5S2_9BACT|nr:type I glyceraldehyde-3-phosphate dehydrogenase [Bremerella volcania]QDU74573.1 Glyceraldehyde-3-phosphate dehydrogenase [Bremerella volcania]
MKRVAINGLGRIGRMVLRHFMEVQPKDVEFVAANDLVPSDNLAYLIKYDSVHGRAPYPVESTPDSLRLGEHLIKVSAERDPAQLPWKELGVDVVIESTGLFTKRDLAVKHISAGARRVLISAPAKDADFTLILGVNDQGFDPAQQQVISAGSCTTNSLVPPLKVLIDNFGIERALVTTIHAYTATQALVDRAAKKKIRGRTAATSLIPTTTGSDVATALVLPELDGRIRALAVRVPIPDGALTDICVDLKQSVTEKEVNASFAKAATEEPLRGILGYTEEELVSADIIGDPRSGIVHGLSTIVVQGSMVKVQVWYDNEYGYSRRLLDIVERLSL